MDIESKKYRIKSTGFGGFTITNKADGTTTNVSSAPHSATLAQISEAAFDKKMAELIAK